MFLEKQSIVQELLLDGVNAECNSTVNPIKISSRLSVRELCKTGYYYKERTETEKYVFQNFNKRLKRMFGVKKRQKAEEVAEKWNKGRSKDREDKRFRFVNQ